METSTQPQPQTHLIDASVLAEALANAQAKTAERSVISNPESKSRAEKRKAIDAELRAMVEAGTLDHEEPRPYMAYSTELCPTVAPTVAECDFPKFIYKRGKRGEPDVAMKKVVWITDYEAERIRRWSELKFMQVPVLDEDGTPVINKRTEQPKMKSVPYSAFIRLIPTQIDKQTGIAVADPSSLVDTQRKHIANLEAELAAFRSGSKVVSEDDIVIDEENKRIKHQKAEAQLNEAEALARDPESLTGKNQFRRGRGQI